MALNCHTAALASATSAGISLLVPFFGGDDDIAALLLALAIVERDSTAELVILSFLEPEKPLTGGGAIMEGDGSESRREVKAASVVWLVFLFFCQLVFFGVFLVFFWCCDGAGGGGKGMGFIFRTLYGS